jgi:hypothetical protein
MVKIFSIKIYIIPPRHIVFLLSQRDVIDPTVKYYAMPPGDITVVVQLTGGVVWYLIGASIT